MNDITLARRDLQDAHRLAARAFGDLRRAGGSDEILAALWHASHHMGRALALLKQDMDV